MDRIREVNSKENKFFKELKKLKTNKGRREKQLFLAEGIKILSHPLNPKYIIFVNNEVYKNYKQEIETKINIDCKIIILTETLFKELSTQENSQGVLVCYQTPKNNINAEENLIVLDEIQDPGNLGTIIRTADATGHQNIILTKGTVDPYSPKVIRSSMGSILNVSIKILERDDLINYLVDKDYYPIATALASDTVPYQDMKVLKKYALVFGNEGKGVSEKLLKVSKQKIKMPLLGGAESLNVGVAVGVALYKAIELKEKS